MTGECAPVASAPTSLVICLWSGDARTMEFVVVRRVELVALRYWIDTARCHNASRTLAADR